MRISESYHQVKKNQQAIQENHVGKLPHHSAVNSDLSDVFHAARHEFGFIRSNNGGHEGATKHSVGSSVTHSVHTSGGSHLRQKLMDVINQHKNDGGVGANNFRNGGMAIINTKEGHKHIIQAQYGTHHSVYSHSINHAVTESTIDEATKPAEPKALRKWNVGDMVHPKVGPHKGEAHKVIHVHPDGSMNIVPQVAVHAQNKYRLGAARCTDEQIDVPVSDKQKAGLDKRNTPKKEKETDSHEHVAVRDVEGKFAGRFKSMKDAQAKHKGGGVTFHPIKLSEEFEPLAEEMEVYEETLDEAKKPNVMNHIRNNVSADDITKHQDGTMTFRRGFFYRHGQSSDKWAQNVSDQLTKAGVKHSVVDHHEHNAPFRGGASVKTQSHFAAKIKLHEEVREGHRVVTTSRDGETFKSAIDEGIKEKIVGAIRRAKAQDHPILQNRRDYAFGKAGDAYSHGDEKKGDRYMKWRAKSQRKNGIANYDHKVNEGEVNEVSKDLLRKYFNSAASSRGKADKADDAKTVAKRDRGIGNAFDKLHEGAYVKPFKTEGGAQGYKSSDKHGHIKFWNEHGKASAHKHAGITEEAVEEGLKRIGAYTTKDGAIMTMHTSENDPKHHMLVTAGKVVASHHGTPQEFHNKLRADGISGALNESREQDHVIHVVADERYLDSEGLHAPHVTDGKYGPSKTVSHNGHKLSVYQSGYDHHHDAPIMSVRGAGIKAVPHDTIHSYAKSIAHEHSSLNEITTSRLLLVTAASKPKTEVNELSIDTLRHYSKKSIDQLRANKGNRDFASKAKKRDKMVNTACQKVVGDEQVKVKATNEETIEEGFSVGDMVRASNPKATPKYKVVGKNATHYELQRPDGGRGNISLSKARVHKVNLDGKRLTESELNELSRTSMGQYVYKASNDRTKQTGDPKKYGNRLKGISLAVDKIADKNKKIRLGVTEGLATHHIHIEDSKGKSHGKIGIKAWDDEMAQRHAERIVGNKPFRGMKVSKITRINEDQIDELSTKTLTNYVKAKRIQQKDYPTPEAFRKAVESQATARKKLTEGDLNELSTKTLGSYIGKAHAALPAHQRRAEGALAILQHNGPKKPGESTSATGARDWAKKEFVQHDTKRFNRNAGIAKAARKLSEEENMTLNLLDEAKRGRPRKNPVIGGVDDNEREHITMQLRKSVSLNGVKPIRFADNSQHTVSPEHAERVLSHYAGLGPDHKEQFQKHIDASHTNMMNYKAFKPTAAQSDIPTARPLNHRTVKKPIERRPLMLSPYEKRANMIRTAVAKQKAKAKA